MRFPVVLAVFIIGSITATEYQCWNFKSTDDLRNQYHKLVNKLRSDLANGNVEMKDNAKAPGGKNIYRLNWDCLMEKMAQKVVDECKQPTTEPNGLSMAYTKVKLDTCNAVPALKKAMQGMWDEVKEVTLDANNPTFDDDKIKNFAVLAYGKATRIGCAQKNCNGELHVACMTYAKGPAKGQAIYEQGTSCTDKAQCTTYEESKCNPSLKLCVAGYPGNTTDTPPDVETSPTTSTTTTTTTTTTATTTTTTRGQSKHCPGQEDMNTDTARDVFMNLHNEHRATIAKGGVVMGNKNKTRPCPRMMKLTKYDCNLEKDAYATAHSCPSTDSKVYNENWFTTTDAKNKKQAAEKAVASWYNEITTGYMDQRTGSHNLLMPNFNITHFARIVWATNTQIGCAVYRCKDNKYHAVCRYGQGVGRPGSQIYFPGGLPCNQCKNNCENNALCL